jgi:MFS family permease
VMATSALLAFWTARLFPAAASTAFTVVILGLALGGVVGPLLAGLLLGPVGAVGVFGLAAGLSAVTGLGLSLADPPRRDALRER